MTFNFIGDVHSRHRYHTPATGITHPVVIYTSKQKVGVGHSISRISNSQFSHRLNGVVLMTIIWHILVSLVSYHTLTRILITSWPLNGAVFALPTQHSHSTNCLVPHRLPRARSDHRWTFTAPIEESRGKHTSDAAPPKIEQKTYHSWQLPLPLHFKALLK